MLDIKVDLKNLDLVRDFCGRLQRQLPYAASLMLNSLARDIQAETRANIPKRFTLRRQWIVKGIRVTPSTKTKLEAVIESVDDFMRRQETGGKKTPKHDQHLALPLRAVRRTKRDIIRPMDLPMNLGQASFDVVRAGAKKTMRGAGGSVFKLRTGSGLEILARRRRGKLELMYLLKRDGDIKPRLGLHTDARFVVGTRAFAHLKSAIDRAMGTAT